MSIVARANPSRSRRFVFGAVLGLMLWVGAAGIAGAAEAKVKFELASDAVAASIRRFSEQTGLEVIYASSLARDVRTQRVSGVMTAREALDAMLRGTGLVAVRQERDGAFTLRRENQKDRPTVHPSRDAQNEASKKNGLTTQPQDPMNKNNLLSRIGRTLAAFAAANVSDAATPANPIAPPPQDELVALSPFEVKADSDKSYGALNSNSITRFNVELEKMPVSADIIGETLMTDVAAFGVEAAIRDFSAGAGSSGNNPESNASLLNPLDRNAGGLSLRGLEAPTVQRDAFMPAGTGVSSTGAGFTSNFDIERIEVINGPQALLYGFSGAGGAVNLVPKQARLGRATHGSFKYQVDQHGHKLGLLDLGVRISDKLAARVVATRQEVGNRRIIIEGPLDGLHAQVAAKVLGNTILRLTTTHTKFTKPHQIVPTITALNTANDARNGLRLRYLLATNQIQAAANGAPSGAGVIANGNVNWNNVDSFGGAVPLDYTRTHRHMLTADTVWNRSFSTQIALGYADGLFVNFARGVSFVAPNVAANTTRQWAASATNSRDLRQNWKDKAARFSAVLTNDLFGGRAKSQTLFGADYVRQDRTSAMHTYVLADANFNPVVNPNPRAARNGLTLIPPVYWSVADGPVRDPLWERGVRNVTLNGVNYVYAMGNAPDPSLVSATNPLGLTGRGVGDYNVFETEIRGVYAANFTNWRGGRLTTLVGARAGEVLASIAEPLTADEPSVLREAKSRAVSINAGVNFALRDWVRPYVTVSDSHRPPSTLARDPYSESAGNSRGLGAEAGFKFFNASRSLSGSLGYYYVNSKAEQFQINGGLVSDINPTGLNGAHRAPGNWINVDRVSRGVQLALTATPHESWRLRLSASHFDSTIFTDKSYAQLYNDQFHANASGQVTYADRTPVFVSSTTAGVVSSTTAGAVPLTIGMMNDARSIYYANPDPFSAQIGANSGAATVLRTVDPVRGAILTGVTGLPITALQIAPAPDAPPPGVIVVSQAGDRSTGNPRFAANFTSVYTLQRGWLKGLRLGGTVAKSWKVSGYYYYENGITPTASRTLFYLPRPLRVDSILGYERRFGRFGFSTQLNIQNMFNSYDVVLLPNGATGFNGARGAGINATLNAEPRMYIWSATVSF